MKIRYLFIAVAIITFSACANKTEPTEKERSQITITAYHEISDMTRSTVMDGGTLIYWEPSDEIKVFFNGSSGRFISQNTEKVTVTNFSGSINVIAGANEGTSSNGMLWGLYPYRSDAVCDGLSVTTTLPAEQTGRAGSFAKNTHITLAQSNSLNLAFYNVCGGLRFSLTQDGIKKVTFEGNNGEAIAGKIKIAFSEGTPVVQEVSDEKTEITLTAPNGGAFQIGQWYYISAIPGSLLNGYTMTFYKESESAKLISSSAVVFKRGIFGSLSEVDNNLVFKETGGESPNLDSFIQFVDPVAKFACVEKFDKNGDGEISYSEAAEVTSLSGLFTNYNTVSSFDEIRYFTNVTSTEDVFSELTKITHITIPDHITILGSFSGCSSLEKVILPAALSDLPWWCFARCVALSDVTLPIGITCIPDGCFYNCASLSQLAIPDTVTSIGYAAFYGCTTLSNLNLPASMTYIGDSAFCNCKAISSMALPEALTAIGQSAFAGCFSLNSIHLKNGVSIGQAAFSSCTSLTSVVLPDDLTTIPDNCFYNCRALSSIAWPQALTSIGDKAFDGCLFEKTGYALELPSSVSTIGDRAFGPIHHLVLPSTSPISIGHDPFVSDYTVLYVPASMVEMYKVRTGWNNYASRIRSINDYPIEPFIIGQIGEAIDLGLSVKWASWNVGASAPEEYGAYFAWGEIYPKRDYDWTTYRWCNGSPTSIIKYNTLSAYGTVDNKTSIDLDDDAAHVYWGGNWRMPTDEEISELLSCYTSRATENGISGFRITSNKEGYTDRSIFLPATGYYEGSSLNLVDSGYYWESKLNGGQPSRSVTLSFFSNNIGTSVLDRCTGHPIRPVCDK